MALIQALARIRTLTDLPDLIAALGHQPAWEEIPLEYWAGRTRQTALPRRSALVGYAAELPWFGFEASGPEPLARSLARILQRRGEIASIVVFDPASGTVCFSVAFEDRPALTLSTQRADSLALSCLKRLQDLPPHGRLATAARIAEALAGEGIGDRFFEAFESQLERMTAAIGGPRRAEDRRSLALLQLNRVLFLYFVQGKGWLDGRPDFLRTQLDGCLARRKHVHRHFLRPLFFGTLNRRCGDRSSTALTFGRIPFLNGGLFEPHPLERGWQGNIPNAVWRDAFDCLFERFHFAVNEGSGTAIAPDMLGRVFEGVMAPGERRVTGTFYTPPALVRALLDECFRALIEQRLRCSAEAAESLLSRQDGQLTPLLENLALLDPAAGSGAFLLGALERLVELQGGADDGSFLRRRILQRNLFGVDINPTAVRLTELRLWLAVIADDNSETPDAVEPLPNLDCLVRQGDSLTDPLGLIARMPFRAGAMGSALAQLRRTFVTATGADKKDAARALRRAEVTAMAECLDRAETEIARAIRECLEGARAPDLFGGRRGADRGVSARLRELRSRRTSIRKARRQLTNEGEVPWFQYECHFADVFARCGGFDMVVGNPPWVRAEKLAPAVREHLGERYRWWKAEGGKSSGYRHQPDLAVAFLERAHELAAPEGIVGLLIPAKIATAGYGTSARLVLARDLTLHTVSDLSAGGACEFAATTYPMALVSAKARPAAGHLVRLELGRRGGRRVEQQHLAGGAPWILREPEAASIALEVAARHSALGDRYAIHLGVKTGANKVFLNPPASVEPSLVRDAFRGRDLRPFRVLRSTPMLWPCDPGGAPLERLPPGAHEHLMSHEAVLRSRTDYKGGPLWALFRTGPSTERFRVVWADLARRLTTIALTKAEHRRLIPLNTCYVMSSPDAATANALAGWLNSTWIRALARLGADPASGGFARFNRRAVGGLPLPETVPGDQRLALLAAEKDPEQQLIDDLAASHLDLPASALRTLASVAGAGAGYRR